MTLEHQERDRLGNFLYNNKQECAKEYLSVLLYDNTNKYKIKQLCKASIIAYPLPCLDNQSVA